MDKITMTKMDSMDSLPKTAGVYLFYDNSEIIYIGKAINVKHRVKNHFQQPSYRDNLFISQVNRIGFLETNSEIEALILEANLIKQHQPKFNVTWKDGKNYFYVAVAKNAQKFPYIFISDFRVNLFYNFCRNTANKFIAVYILVYIRPCADNSIIFDCNS